MDEDDYMDVIFRREARHDVMMAAIVCFFMILLLIALPVCSDAPLPLPAKHEVLSPNKRFRAELDPREGTKIISVESGTVLWKLPDWYRWAFLADDGEHFVTGYDGLNLIPLEYTRELVLITFWRKHKKIKEITVGDLFPDTGILQRTASHYHWGTIQGIDKDGHLQVERCDGTRFLFDIKTGERGQK